MEKKPTTEQLRLAQLHSRNDQIIDDPNQKAKIELVMSITQKPEDAVATALYDTEWDTNLAAARLIEGDGQATEWEEAKKGGKKKNSKTQISEDREFKETKIDKEFPAKNQEDRNLSNKRNDAKDVPRQQLPPRMRRGGNAYQNNRGRRAARTENNNNNESNRKDNSIDEQNIETGSKEVQVNRDFPRRGRGQGSRGRGGNRYIQRGRGGRRSVEIPENPETAPIQPIIGSEYLDQGTHVFGYSGNLERWNPSHSNEDSPVKEALKDETEKIEPEADAKKELHQASSWATECADISNEQLEDSSSPVASTKNIGTFQEFESKSSYLSCNLEEGSVKTNMNYTSSSGFVSNNSWRKPSPVTDEWDNEEYTGSLAHTKVFTNKKNDQQRPKGFQNKLVESNFHMTKGIRQPPILNNDINRGQYNHARSTPEQKIEHAKISPPHVSYEQVMEDIKNYQPSETNLNEIMEKAASKIDMKNSQTTQTDLPPHPYPPGFSHLNNNFNVSAINRMLLGQAQASVQQAQSPFVAHQAMTPSPWISLGNPNLSSQQLQNILMSQQVEQPSLTGKSISSRLESSVNSKEVPMNMQLGGKMAPNQGVSTSDTLERGTITTVSEPIDARPASRGATHKEPVLELQRDVFHSRSRLPPPSKIPDTAVEMPGDYSAGLDVQFGSLDLSVTNANVGEQSSSYDMPFMRPLKGQDLYAGSTVSSQSGNYPTSTTSNTTHHNHFPANANFYNQLNAYRAVATPPVRNQNSYPPPNNPPQSGHYIYPVPSSTGPNQYVNVNHANLPVSMGQTVATSTRGQNPHMANNNQMPSSGYIPSNVQNQYLSPNKPSQVRPYGSSVPTAPNSQNQYVSQMAHHGGWVEGQREQYYYVDPSTLGYLNYGMYNS